jgi:chain length determinant protein EpsF
MVFLVIFVSLLLPRTYVAEADVVINSVTTDPVSGREMPTDALPANLATQLDVIASANVALKVVDALNLTKSDFFREKYELESKDLFGYPRKIAPIREWIADRLLSKHLTVVPPKEGNVIGIDAAAEDQDFAAKLANAFAEAFIQTHLELKLQPERRQADWFNAQVGELHKAVENAQSRLSEFQRAHTVTGTDSHVDVENERLNQISDQLIVAQTAMYDARTRLNQMNEAIQRGQLEEIPDIQGDTLLQTMKANLAVAEGKLAQTSSGFGKNHPEYISAEAQVKELRDKLLAEVDVARGAIAQSAAISERKEAELRHALEQQRDRLLALKRDQDQIESLKRDVTNTQAAYDAGVQRATEVRLESRLDQSNIAVLNPATPPRKIARPKLVLNTLLAIILGTALGIAAAVAKEMVEPRLRSPLDLDALFGLGLLAVIPRQQRSSKLSLRRRRALRKPQPVMLAQPSDGQI